MLRKDAIPAGYLTAPDFAKHRNISYGRVGNLIYTRQLRLPDDQSKDAVVSIGHRRYIHPEAVIVLMRFPNTYPKEKPNAP